MSLFKRRLALAAIGVAPYGSDDAPDGTNAILHRNLQVQVFQGNTETLDYDKPSLGAGIEYYTGPHAAVSFDVDLAGSGTAGTAPAWGVLLRMCGFGETINAGVDVTYNLVSDSFEWGTLYINLAGELHKLLGARGNVSFNMTKEGMPYASFNFLGLWDQTPTAVAAPTPSGWDDFIDPIPVNEANTPTLQIDSYDAKGEEVMFDAGQQVEYRNVINDEQVFITDRNASGRIAIEKPLLSEKDFYAVVRNHSVVPVTCTHGVTAGNILTFNAKGQLKFGQDQDSQGINVMPFDLNLVPTSAGDDELELVLT